MNYERIYKEIQESMFETLKNQYELYQKGFITESEWEQRREMGYIMFIDAFGYERDEIAESFAHYMENQ